MKEFFNKHPGLLAVIFIIIFTILVNYIILATDDGSTKSTKTGGTCGICGGSGVVSIKFLGEGSGVQRGYDTYYRCKGCHGTGKS